MKKLLNNLKDIWYVLCLELHRIFSDPGVIVIFFLAGLSYPVLYSYIYHKENLTDLPVAVVDESQSADSRRFITKLNATPEVNVVYRCVNMADAEQLFRQHKVRGVVRFPSDYDNHLSSLEQATVSLYCDMSSFLYYRSVYMGVNYVMLDEMHNIQLKRYNALGMNGEDAMKLVEGIPYQGVDLFLPSQGFSSFLLPTVLILILHQTLLIGVAMLSGTAYENSKRFIPRELRFNGTHRVVIGRGLAYFIIYAGLSFYALVLIPHLFHLPHLATLSTLAGFVLPFLLATIFFSITIGCFIHNRETGIVILAPLTIIFMFISGFAWPSSNIPRFWQLVSYLIPSTFGINGFIRINTMGATLAQIRPLIISMWVQAGFYFLTATIALRLMNHRRYPQSADTPVRKAVRESNEAEREIKAETAIEAVPAIKEKIAIDANL